jgi:hypothetical protein
VVIGRLDDARLSISEREEGGRLWVSGGYAYIVPGHRDTNYLHIVDVADPTNPQFLTTFTGAASHVTDVLVDGDVMILGAYWRGFEIYDLTDPISPVYLAGGHELPLEGYFFAWSPGRLRGHHLVVPTLSDLNVIDVPRGAQGAIGTVVAFANLAQGPPPPPPPPPDGPDGPAAPAPVSAMVTSPNPGFVVISTGPAGSDPQGFGLLGCRVSITAPAATPEDPLVIRFQIEASAIPPGIDAAMIDVFRDGVLVLPCLGSIGVASPDPCVASRTTQPDGDVEIVVLSSTASDWAFAVREWQDPIDFGDDDGSPFEADIVWLSSAGITRGCTSAGDRYCPDDHATRGQLAAFLTRALGLNERLQGAFTDDDGSPFEADIERLAALGITHGCGPGHYCPDGHLTRGQLAAFLTRALGLNGTQGD